MVHESQAVTTTSPNRVGAHAGEDVTVEVRFEDSLAATNTIEAHFVDKPATSYQENT